MSKVKKEGLIVGFIILCAILLRVPFLNYPLAADYHHMRQTHTAIPIQRWIEDGKFNAADYQIPVFGSPWQAPFEYPVYQTTAYLTSTLFTNKNIDVACRITSLFYFIVSSLFLYLICGFYTKSLVKKGIILSFYLFSTHALQWSIAALPDNCAICFALIYYFFLMRCLKKVSIPDGVVVIISGILAYLAKSTVMIPIVLVLAVMMVTEISVEYMNQYNAISAKSVIKYIGKNIYKYIVLGGLCVVPVIPTIAWNKYADKVKESSVWTQWITSTMLKGWNFGTWEQKTSLEKWLFIFKRMQDLFFPGIIILSLLVWVTCIWRRKEVKEKIFQLSLIVSIFVTIFISFNVYYVHDYYLIALSPFIAIIGGNGIYFTYSILKYFIEKTEKANLLKTARVVIPSLLILCTGLSWAIKDREYVNFLRSGNIEAYKLIEEDAKVIDEMTEKTDYLFITDEDWNPRTLYMTNRKGFMIRTPEDEDAVIRDIQNFKDNNYNTIIAAEGSEYIEKLLEEWDYYDSYTLPSGKKIYKVYNK